MASCRRVAAILSVVALVDAASVALAVSRAPFPIAVELGSPTAYLNLYVHVPIAWMGYALFALAMVSAILYLARRDERYDRLTTAFVAVGEVYGVATIVTGMAWAHESWGAAWNWDPRETGVLLLVLAYLGYFAVRNSIPDPERRRLVSAAYAVAAFSMVPLSFAAAYMLSSLHPSFQQARHFMWTGSVAAYFVPRIILATTMAVGLAYLAYRSMAEPCRCRLAMAAGAAVILVGAALAAWIAAPYASSSPARVANATLTDDGRIEALQLVPGGWVRLPTPVESPVKPATTPDGRPSIVGHLVLVEDGRVEVVRHWSVAFDSLVYLTITGSLLVVLGSGRLYRGAGGGEEQG